MFEEQVLQWFWGGLVEYTEASEASSYVQALQRRSHVQVVSVSCGAMRQAPVAMSEADELAPGLTVGDVLHEELDVFVEPGTIVVFEATGVDGDAAETVSYAAVNSQNANVYSQIEITNRIMVKEGAKDQPCKTLINTRSAAARVTRLGAHMGYQYLM